MNIKITKEHIGKIVYALPTGNNARRHVDNQDYIEFEVVSVARVYAKIKKVGSNHTLSVDPFSGATQEAIRSGYTNNAGYKFFETKEDLLNFQEDVNIRRKCADMMVGYSWHKRLSLDTIKLIISELEQDTNV